ncbi:MAG: hypothetical protein NT098_03480 [Candidatus Parcubacteria bacterium]|nr:hypothetical protein [Candidatus Parcubacteria bacterium]
MDLYPENKAFTPTENIKAVIDCIASARNALDKVNGEIILTSEIFPQILMDENVLLFFITLYRTDIIEDLYLPVGVSKGSGDSMNFHYGPDYLGNHDIAYRAAIDDPKAFKKNFVSLRIPNWKAFQKVRDGVYEKLNVKSDATTDNKLAFDKETGVLSLNGAQVEIPINTNQFYLTKKLFEVSAGTRVKETNIMDMIDWSKDSNRSVYDATRLVNKRVKEHLGISKLFKWRMNTVWREQ